MSTSKRGRKKIEWNEVDAKIVESFSQYGVPQNEISQKIGICVDVMNSLYQAEIARGKGHANANIGKRLYQKAMDGDTAALIFWAKTRMGWRETNRVDLVSSDKSMSPASSINLAAFSAEQLAALRGELDARKRNG